MRSNPSKMMNLTLENFDQLSFCESSWMSTKLKITNGGAMASISIVFGNDYHTVRLIIC